MRLLLFYFPFISSHFTTFNTFSSPLISLSSLKTFYSNSVSAMPFKDPHLVCITLKIQLGLFLNQQNLLILMAGEASKCLLFLLLLSIPAIYDASATLVGFSYDARKSVETSLATKTVSFLKLNKISPSQIRVFVKDSKVLSSLFNTGVSVDLYLNETRVKNPRNSVTSSLKTHLLTFLPHVNIKSVVASSIRSDLPGKNELARVLSTLKSTHSILSSFGLGSEVKVSVAFSLKFLEKLDGKGERDLDRIFRFIKRTGSFVIVEASVDGELSMGDRFVQAVIEKASHANAVLLPCSDVPMMVTVKSPAVPSGIEVAEFSDKISKSLEKNTEMVTSEIIGIFAEVSDMEEFNHKEMKREEEQLFPTFRRELLKTTSHDAFDSPTTTFPTSPVTIPLDNPTPTIVTVPSSSPVTITPANPDAPTPVTVPSTTPITIPPVTTSPVTTPVTVPGPQPITNPVTTYPAPTGNIPATTPFTSPVTPPAIPNSPAAVGESWCVSKTGATETALQAALDYACGIGGADCSTIQPGASCYNPNTLQTHASYAFNSYYQKNPIATSCDFGGSAVIVNINPSTGSCVFPSSSSSSTPTVSSPMTTAPTTTTPTTTTSSWPDISGSGTPPTVLNTSNPASATTTSYGSGSPQGARSVSESAALLRPFVGSIILLTSLITTKITLDI